MVVIGMNASTTGPATGVRITLPVEGMTCAACQASVQKALQRQPGVLDASVNLMMKNAAVTYDPAVTGPEALVEAVRDTGYEAELPRPEQTAFAEQEARDRAQERGIPGSAAQGPGERCRRRRRHARLHAAHGGERRTASMGPTGSWPIRSCAGPWSR